MRLAFLLFALLPAALAAQGFPSRQITIVVPYSPGSTSDLLPRAIAPLLAQSMGVPVIVENRPGAGGNVGAAVVAKGDASGHTRFRRTYLFDFSDDGIGRRTGSVVMLGAAPESLQLEPYRLGSDSTFGRVHIE